MTEPAKIAITGAAGQISYSLVFRIAAGDFLGPGRPVELRLLEVDAVLGRLEGVCMELDDCAFPLLSGYRMGSDPEETFDGIDHAFLVGAMPRKQGMERKDLLSANASIFSEQGRALNAAASRSVKVVVVGNPANTNALIAHWNAPDIPAENFTAMTRLDHNRALAMLARKAGVPSTDISGLAIWGNHSSTQYPSIQHASIGGTPAAERVDGSWYRDRMIPAVQQRGAEVIRVRGASSAASAASASIDHMRDWALGTPEGGWTSMGVVGSGQYGVGDGLVFSYPVTCADGAWEIVDGLEIDEHGREMLRATDQELREEREAVRSIFRRE